MRRPWRCLTDTSGAAALEFALIGLPFILLLLGLIEFGRGLYIRNALDDAADRAQRVIMIDQNASTQTLDAAIRDAFRAGRSDRLTISYGQETSGTVGYRYVSLRYAMQLLMPAPLGRSIVIVSNRRVAAF